MLETKGGDSCGKSMGLETPQRAFFASEEAGSHALRRRPPVVESNGFKKVLDYSHQHLHFK